MNWIDKMERNMGKHAVPGIYRYFLAGILIGYLLEFAGKLFEPANLLMEFLRFDPQLILHGQIWRLVSWVLLPCYSLDVFGLIFLLCVLSWGKSVEMLIGTFRTNVLLIGGVVIFDILGLLVYGISTCYYLLAHGAYGGIPVYLTTYYILLSMLMVLAILLPDGEVRLWFVLPIRMKWMLYLEIGYILYGVADVFALFYGQGGVEMAIAYTLVYAGQGIFALLNLAFFCLTMKRSGKSRFRKKKNAAPFVPQVADPRPGSGIVRHRCAICNRTEADDPELTFRYCSMCTGGREYCQDHLFTHTHVIGEPKDFH